MDGQHSREWASSNLELREVGVLGRDLKGESANHGLLNSANVVQALLLDDGHLLLVLVVDDRVEFLQGRLEACEASKTGILEDKARSRRSVHVASSRHNTPPPPPPHTSTLCMADEQKHY